MKDVPQGEPFAVIHDRDKDFAVYENIGYEGESYSIFELAAGHLREVLVTFGGGC